MAGATIIYSAVEVATTMPSTAQVSQSFIEVASEAKPIATYSQLAVEVLSQNDTSIASVSNLSVEVISEIYPVATVLQDVVEVLSSVDSKAMCDQVCVEVLSQVDENLALVSNLSVEVISLTTEDICSNREQDLQYYKTLLKFIDFDTLLTDDLLTMLSNIAIPTCQISYLDPYKVVVYDGHKSSNEYFINMYINKFFKPLGPNVLIEGITVKSAEIDNNKLVTIVFDPGIVIVNEVCIEFPSEITVTLDCSDYDSSGYLIANIGYYPLQTTEKNNAYIKLTYYNNVTATPLDWDIYKDTLVIGYFTFNNDLTIINDLTPGIGESKEYVTVSGITYTVAPQDWISNRILLDIKPKIKHIKLTNTHITNGYVTLPYVPFDPKTVNVSFVNGQRLLNKNVLENTSDLVTTYTNIEADFDVWSNRIFLKNGTFILDTGGHDYVVSGLSNVPFKVDDILQIEYYY